MLKSLIERSDPQATDKTKLFIIAVSGGVLGKASIDADKNLKFTADTTPSTTAANVITVELTMPLGGQNSGLFRVPRIGERVLVVKVSDAYYLQSYLSSADCVFDDFDQKHVLNQLYDATLLHYSRNDQHGECGFINGKKVEEFLLDKIMKGTAHDFLKTIAVRTGSVRLLAALLGKGNLHGSTNYTQYLHDIAANYYSTDETKKTDAQNKLTAVLKVFGLTDEKAYTGVIHETHSPNTILQTADKRYELQAGEIMIGGSKLEIGTDDGITIRSAKKIDLIVGGQSISISQSGIKINSKQLMNFAGPLNSSIALSPDSGVKISGLSCKMTGAFEASVKDVWGGGIGIEAGMTKVSGVELDTVTIPRSKIKENLIRQFVQSGLMQMLPSLGYLFSAIPCDDPGNALGTKVEKTGNKIMAYLKSIADTSLDATFDISKLKEEGAATVVHEAYFDGDLPFASTALGVMRLVLKIMEMLDKTVDVIGQSCSAINLAKDKPAKEADWDWCEYYKSHPIVTYDNGVVFSIKSYVTLAIYAAKLAIWISFLVLVFKRIKSTEKGSISMFCNKCAFNVEELASLSRSTLEAKSVLAGQDLQPQNNGGAAAPDLILKPENDSDTEDDGKKDNAGAGGDASTSTSTSTTTTTTTTTGSGDISQDKDEEEP